MAEPPRHRSGGRRGRGRSRRVLRCPRPPPPLEPDLIGQADRRTRPGGDGAFPLVDVTDAAAWDDWAAGLEPLALDAARILVVAPHPDDETFGCGGLIAAALGRGADVAVVTVTDGAASHPGHPGLAARRRAEQRAAVRALGCERDPWLLGFPDGGIADREADVARVLRALAVDVDLVVGPWPGDRHPDHEVSGRAALAAAAAMGVRAVTYPVWLWRWGTPADLDRSRTRRLALDRCAQQAKAAAMASFPSQTTDLAGGAIVDEAMLERFARAFEVFVDA